jgi:hypothetical protein
MGSHLCAKMRKTDEIDAEKSAKLAFLNISKEKRNSTVCLTDSKNGLIFR